MKDYDDYLKISEEIKYPLTVGQKGLWLLHQLDSLSDSYNMPLTFKFSNNVKLTDLEKILNVFVQRHTMMRSTFHDVNGSLFRKVNQVDEIRITEYNVGFLNQQDLQTKVRNLSGVPFDLETGPLIRAHILNDFQGGKILLLTIHHLIFDGASLKVLCDEFELIYQSLIQSNQLNAIKYDYNDFQIWQQQWLQSEDAQSSRDYWLDKFNGELPQLNLSHDKVSSKSQSVRGEFLKFSIPQTVVKRFKQLSKNYKCSEYLIWLVAYFAFLSRYTSQQDIIVGTPAMGRPEPKFDDIVGYFVNVIPLRCQLSSDDSFIDVLTVFKSEIYEALMHADYPLAELINALGDTSQRGDQPLFQTSFIWTVIDGLKSKPDALLGVQVHPLIHESGEQNLSLELLVSNDGIKVLLKYRTNCFFAKSIDRIKHSFINFIDNISTDPTCEIQKVAIVNNKDEQYLLHEMNDTQVDYVGQMCFHQMFEQQVEKTPNNIAVVFEDQSLTYSELNNQANQFAHYLIEKGYQSGKRVGVYLEYSLVLLPVVLGIIKSGNSYVALEPSHPKDRLSHIIKDAEINLVVLTSDLVNKIPSANIEQLLMDKFTNNNDTHNKYAIHNPNLEISLNNEIYTLYTSGSTGQPKGAMINHKGLSNYIQYTISEYFHKRISGSIVSSPLCFDATITTLLTPLCVGKSVEILPSSDEVLSLLHARLFEQSEPLLFKITPAHLEALAHYQQNSSAQIDHQIVVGGEQLSFDLIKKWKGKLLPSATFINEYGPTETVVGCCVFKIEDQQCLTTITTTSVPIGRAINNTQLYVLNDKFSLQAKGSIGELYIAGHGVANGYVNNEELTKLSFIKNPFDEGRLYKTGDLVRYLEDDALLFIGRVDDQIKIRGFRIELGEIEQQLIAHKLVDSALVTINQTDEDKKIVAYLTSQSSIKESELVDSIRSGLHEKIPDYMIPSTFVILEQFPLTTSGKIDRKSLPAPEDVTQFSGRYKAPESKIELMLVAIWSELLNIPQEKISADANFFALGGHSLLVIKLINDINKKTHTEIKYIDVFNYSILNDLSIQIDNKLNINGLKGALNPELINSIKNNADSLAQDSSTLEPNTMSKIDRSIHKVETSYAQRRLWFIDKMDGGSSHYNMPHVLDVIGGFRVDIAQAVFTQIIQRHEPLRTVFDDGGDGPLQVIHQQFDFSITRVDLSHLTGDAQNQAVEAAIKADASQPFDLNKDLMLRVSYLHTATDKGVMLFNMHHIASDGWSINILFDEFARLYHSIRENTPSPLVPLAIEYADYAYWQRLWLQGESLESQLAYWDEKLTDLPQTHSLPLDFERPVFQTFNGGLYHFKLDSHILEQLKSIALENQVTLFMLMHAAFSVLLSRYSNNTDIVIGTPVANRLQKDLEPLIGFFVNSLVLRADCSGNPKFTEFLTQIKATNLEAQANQDVPFEHLVDRLNPVRSTSHNALFQVVLMMDGDRMPAIPIKNIKITKRDSNQVPIKFELTLNFSIKNNQLACIFQYNTDLFELKFIERLGNSMQRLLTAIVADPKQPIAQLPLLSSKEIEYQLYLLNNTQNNIHSSYSKDLCAHQLFEKQVAKTPNEIAIIFEKQSLTYLELNKRANQLAHYLTVQGVKVDSFVGLCLERSLEMVVAILAIWKAGGAYLPLDPSYPKTRLKYMIKDSALSVLLTQQDFIEVADVRKQLVLDDQKFLKDLTDYSIENPVVDSLRVNHLAYIIYTSGSTGQPKGVMIEHHSVVNLSTNINQIDPITKKGHWGWIASLSFDASVQGLCALITGQTLEIISTKAKTDKSILDKLLNKKTMTFLDCTPTLLELWFNIGLESILPNLLIGGEAISNELWSRLIQWQKKHNKKAFNVYGPTESCVNSSFTLIDGCTPHIGKVLDNIQFYILDASQRLIPFGSIGELYIAGAGLARGYLNQDKLTAERFIQHPFGSDDKDILYRTGDLVRYLHDGKMSFVGRIDDQVKIRGFRIELGEIEQQLNDLDDVQSSLLTVYQGADEQKQLVAYLTIKHIYIGFSEDELISQLRSELHQVLPDYMLPSMFVILDKFPLTANGKIDRRSLPEPDTSIMTRKYIAPKNETELVLTAIWSDLLKVPQAEISAAANFFELGGHSLISVRLVTEIRERLKTELSIRDIFEYSELRELSNFIKHSQQVDLPKMVAIKRDSNMLQPSYAQQRLWFIDQMENGSNQYNMVGSIKVDGDFNIKVAQQAFTKVVQRHEPLRTIFVENNNKPLQLIKEDFSFKISQSDLTKLDDYQQGIKCKTIIDDVSHYCFDLSKDLMLRVHYIKLKSNQAILIINVHHIAFDGWSTSILMDEFSQHYQALIAGKKHILPQLTIQYVDYAYWQRQWLDGAVLESQLSYWERQLADLPQVHNLPLDYKRPDYQTFNGAEQHFELDHRILQKLRSISVDNKVTLFMLIHAAFSILLSRYSNSTDIVIGTPVANRTQKELEGLIGFFVNILILRANCSGNPSFVEFLAQIKNTNLDAQVNQDLPFEHLVDRLNPPRSTNHNALFQIMLSMNTNDNVDLTLPNVTLGPQQNEKITAKFDLMLNAATIDNNKGKSGLYCSFVYNNDLFSKKTIECLANSLQMLLQSIALDSTQTIAQLPILNHKETHYLLNTLNDTQTDYPKGFCIHQLFEHQVAKTPNNVAVVFENQSLSYVELNKQANQLAHCLIKKGIEADDFVGLLFERSHTMIIALMAVMKAGGAYLPLDPDYPKGRLQHMIQDSNISLLLTQQDLVGLIDTQSCEKIVLDDSESINTLQELPSSNPDIEGLTSDNLAYVIYTSGSTGQPKGVMIEHHSVINLSMNISKIISNKDQGYWGWVAPLSFDSSIKGLCSLITGQGLCVISKEVKTNEQALRAVLTEKKLSIIDCTPTLLSYWMSIGLEALMPDLMIGGEAISNELWSNLILWQNKYNKRAFNLYGPTEACVDSSLTLVEGVRPHIGKVLNNIKFFILDRNQQLMPFGYTGELYIGGVGLARGYLNQPELTNEQFIQYTFDDNSTQRLYKTGDLACYRTDGNLSFIGRADDQVKIRGFRIELGEIEQQLSSHPAIGSSLVLVHQDDQQEKKLVAYYTTNALITDREFNAELRLFLQNELPDYMLPSLLIKVEHFPLTANGKIDHKSLPLPDLSALESEYIEPVGDTEQGLVSIWSQLLKIPVENISADAHFFELGGHSLLSIRLLAEIRTHFNCELSVRTIFETPRLSQLAELVISSESYCRPIVTKCERDDKLMVTSFAQQRLWFIDKIDGNSAHYNMPSAMRLRGNFSVDKAQAAFRQVIQRHESLRTVFVEADNGPLQDICDQFIFNISQVDISELNTAAQNNAITVAIKEDAQKPFDLSKDVMLRVSYLRISADEGVLLFNMHHIASDGWSTGILTSEFVKLYASNLHGKENPLLPLDIQYADYAYWQRNWLSGAVLESQLSYWDKQLVDLPPVHSLPLDYERPIYQTFNGAVYQFKVDKNILKKLKSIALENQSTLFMLMHAAFSIVISRYSNNQDIVIGTPVANRMQKELEGLIGFFVNTLVLRADCSGNPSFKQFLAQIKNTNLDAQANQDVPFEHLVDRLNPHRNTSYNALFQIMLSMNTNEAVELTLPNVTISQQENKEITAKFDLLLNAIPVYDEGTESGLSCSFVYNTDLFSSQTIERLANSLQLLLVSIAADASQSITQLALLSDEETYYLLHTLNDTQVDYPDQLCVHQLFELQVEKKPDYIAVTYEGQSLTYFELNAKANQLAHYLIEQGIKPDDFIGLCFERSLDMMVALLAILKAGAAYLPLDPSYPKGRLGYMMDDSQLTWVLTQKDTASICKGKKRQLLLVDDQKMLNNLNNYATNNPIVKVLSANNLAYVIYTSGSTGKPKAVMLEHHGATNLSLAQIKHFSVEQKSRVLQFASINFDAATSEWMMALLSGATLYICEQSIRQNPDELADYLCHNSISHATIPPALLQNIDIKKTYAFKALIVAGEAIDGHLSKKWGAKYNFYNAYGPTETTVCATMSSAIKTQNVNIGKAIANTQVYVLDDYHQLLPKGSTGELYIGGVGLARGYLNQPELTTEKFILNPFSHQSNARLYRTGDLVRCLDDGNLEFIGRVDHQVKIRGFRIELGEIEQQIIAHKDVRLSVVLVTEEQKLVAYFTTDSSTEESKLISDIRSLLQNYLPDYMVPSVFVKLDCFPVNANGKVDRKSLPLPDMVGFDDYVAPVGKVEQGLVNIWAQLLKVPAENISAKANFFELGGHSLLSVRLLGEVRTTFGCELSVREVFEIPQLSAFAQKITDSHTSIRPQVTVSERHSHQLVTSYAQQRLWFIDKMDGGSAHYNMPFAMQLHGDFKVDAAQMAFSQIIARHESLRTVFVDSKNGPLQLIRKQFKFNISEIDISQLTVDAQKKTVNAAINKDALKSFDLKDDLMLRVSFFHLSDDEGVLLFNMHHIASDGWSIGVLMNEFVKLYQSNIDGKEALLKPLAIQYADYAYWQRQWLRGEVLESQLSYWDRQLADLPQVHALPLDFERPEYQSFNGGSYQFKLSNSDLKSLESIALANEVSLFMLIHAAFSILLSRYSNSSDIVIGTPVANRTDSQLEGLIGFFVNTLILRTDCSENQPFVEFLKQIKNTNLDAQANQDVPFEHLVDRINPSRNTSHNALFQIMFNMNTNEQIEFKLPNVTLSLLTSSEVIAKFDLMLNAIVINHDENETESGLNCSFVYNTDLFKTQTIERLAESLQSLLKGIARDATQKIKQLPLLSDTESLYLLETLNDTHVDHPTEPCIHELFEAQVIKTPNNTAVVCKDQSLSYSELNKQANQLAHHLISQGVKADDFVGLCVERSLEMMVGLLAILKAGGAYLPLDPSYPKDRLTHMLGDSQVSLLLTQTHLTDELLFDNQQTICIDKLSRFSEYSTENINKKTIGLDSDKLAYIIYTSGSTGKPKGAAVEHRNETNLLYWYCKKYDLNSDDKVLILSAIGFDLTQKNLFAPLISGGSVQFATSRFYDVNKICDFIEKNKITLTNCAPSVFYPLVEHEQNIHKLSSLRCVLFGGETIAFDRLNNWLNKAADNLQLINMYGPTECTDISCAYQILIKENNNIAPIGRANDNVQLYVLNEQQQLSPFGVVGELCVGGLGVSRGYLNQRQLTTEKFITHPFSDNNNAKIYRTGDLVKWVNDRQLTPQLEFIGRIDSQIKIRGFRVELGEIESLLCTHNDISQAVVIYDNNKGQLHAYIVVHNQEGGELTFITAFLKKKLPEYMLPHDYTIVDELPLNTHGKIDKKALSELKGTVLKTVDSSQQYSKPQGKTEIALTGIWSQLLNIPENQISTDANFFELGGHSLLLTNMLHLIIENMHVQLSVKDIFHAPTISAIAQKITLNVASDKQQLYKQDNSEPLPLSYGQYRIWFIEQLREQTNEHNIAVASKIKGHFKAEILEQALNSLIQQHDILRTRIIINNIDNENTPMQMVEPSFIYKINLIDLSKLAESQKNEEISRLSHQQDTQVFDISQLPLLSVLLLKTTDNEYLLHFNQHHIISDGWSQQLFYSELMKRYGKISRQGEIIQSNTYNYADYAVWQQQWLQSDTAEQQRIFWKEYLADCNEQIHLPIQNHEGTLVSDQNLIQAHIELSLSAQLKTIAHAHKGSLFNILHSTFVLLLARLSGQTDFNIGLPVTGRHIYGTQDMLGMFLNTLPVRHQLELNCSFENLFMAQIQNIEHVLSNQDLPLEQIFEITGCERNAQSTPLFQILFNMLSVPDGDVNEGDFDFEMSGHKTAEIENKFDITLYLKDSVDGVNISCHYNSSAFSSEHIEHLIQQYINLLSQIAVDMTQPCHQYCLNNGPHKIDYDHVINQTDIDVEDVTALFRKQVYASPEAIAIKDEYYEWSYQQLLEHSYGLAQELRVLGVQRGDIITIMATRGAKLIAGIFAVLQLGAAYSIVTDNMPEKRIIQHMEIVNNKVTLLCDKTDTYKNKLIENIKLISAIKTIANEPDYYAGLANDFIAETDLLNLRACITFTSGSSGVPKAVTGLHLGLSGYFNWLTDYVGFNPKDHFGMLSALAHDPLQRDIFGALCNGATLVIPTKQQFDAFEFSHWLKQQSISILHLTPAMAEIITSQPQVDLSQLKVVFLTGETLRRDTAQALLKLNPDMRIFNCYGATETQRAATYFEVTDIENISAVVPMAMRTPDTRLRLVNTNGGDCGIGEIGQICTESSRIASGYLNDKVLTQARFSTLTSGLRRYATGDSGVCLDGENIKYLGRADSQINIRGFRIELGEIEYQLSQHSQVRSCTTVVHNDEQIIAYVTANNTFVNEADFIKDCQLYLQDHLAEYMLPSTIVLLDEMPLTANRKIDKKALPVVDQINTTDYKAPESDTEIQLTKIWAGLLKQPEEKIGVNANFFELGGHSLLLLKLITEIRSTFAQEIRLKYLFESENLRSLAELIDSLLKQVSVIADIKNTSQEFIEEFKF